MVEPKALTERWAQDPRATATYIESIETKLQAQLKRALDEDINAGLDLCLALAPYWITRGHAQDGISWIERLLEAGALDQTLKGRAYQTLGKLRFARSDFEGACESHQQALLHLSGEARAETFNHLGVAERERGRFDAARVAHEGALELAEEPRGRALALGNLGVVLRELGELQRAQALLQESLALRRSIGDRLGEASALSNLGMIALDQGELQRAGDLHAKAAELRGAQGDTWGCAATFTNQGLVARARGELDKARAFHERGLQAVQALDDHLGIAEALEGFALLMIEEGRPKAAAVLIFYAQRLREKVGAMRSPSRSAPLQRALLKISSMFEEGIEPLEEEARRLSLQEAVALTEA